MPEGASWEVRRHVRPQENFRLMRATLDKTSKEPGRLAGIWPRIARSVSHSASVIGGLTVGAAGSCLISSVIGLPIDRRSGWTLDQHIGTASSTQGVPRSGPLVEPLL